MALLYKWAKHHGTSFIKRICLSDHAYDSLSRRQRPHCCLFTVWLIFSDKIVFSLCLILKLSSCRWVPAFKLSIFAVNGYLAALFGKFACYTLASYPGAAWPTSASLQNCIKFIFRMIDLRASPADMNSACLFFLSFSGFFPSGFFNFIFYQYSTTINWRITLTPNLAFACDLMAGVSIQFSSIQSTLFIPQGAMTFQ